MSWKAPARGAQVVRTLWKVRTAHHGANLHRSELTVQERADHVAEWVRLTEAKAQLAPSRPGGRPDQGINAASRDLGLERTQVQRAVKIASIIKPAKRGETDMLHLIPWHPLDRPGTLSVYEGVNEKLGGYEDASRD